MAQREKWPVALTIAGSDSGGGAGIQADLKTFAALDVHGTSAITCLTAQNPTGVTGVHECPADVVGLQIEAVVSELRPAAVKTGMLFSEAIIKTVAEAFGGKKKAPLVVDPVMVATSGARLLQESAIAALRNELLPLAALVTPNLDETVVLTGEPIAEEEDMRTAARTIHKTFGCAVLIKGGHLRRSSEAMDIFYDGETELLLTAPFVKGVATHGTGCTYSAAIAGYIALGCELSLAVQMAKEYVTQSIAQSVRIGRHSALNPFWR